MGFINKIQVGGQNYDIATNKIGNGLELNENNEIVTKDKYIRKDVYLGDNSQPSGMTLNKITNEGIYEFYLQSRTYDSYIDDIPVLNNGNGHTIAGRLNVVDASFDDKETMITQKLLLSNRVGGEGKEFIRSCKEGIWTPWLTTATMQEVGMTDNYDNYIDNRMYSGVYIGSDIGYGGSMSGLSEIMCAQYETFVIVTINNYAVVQAFKEMGESIPQYISQFKYAVMPNGTVTFLKRLGIKYEGETTIDWGNWQHLFEL